MKKFGFTFLALAMSAILSLSCFAADRTAIDVPEGTPTIDGEIDNAEWNRDNYIVMDSTNCQAWAGDIADQVTFYYYWDAQGLYCGAKVVDTDVNLTTDGSSPYSLDCFQIALNPNGMIADDQQGIFLSMGVTDTGNVEVQRHNYQDGLITDKCTGKGKQTADGWQMELLIPWSEINVLDTQFDTPAEGFTFTATICLLDRDDGGATTNAFKTVLPDGDVADFSVGSYALTLNLVAAVDIATDDAAVTEAPAADDTAVTEAPAADAAADTAAPVAAAQTSDAVVAFAALATLAAAAAIVVTKKNH
ncbi:MAG: sugar-binding protein [Eubacteriales bacterium]